MMAPSVIWLASSVPDLVDEELTAPYGREYG